MDYKKIMDSLFKENFELEQQRDQLKAERESMISDFQKKLDLVRMLKDENRKLETQKIAFQRSYKQVYEENEKLEQIREIKDSALKGADIKIKTLERENERLRVKSDSFFERWKFKKFMYTDLSKESDKYKSLLSEISQHIGNKPSSSTYKYFRGKLNALEIREGE